MNFLVIGLILFLMNTIKLSSDTELFRISLKMINGRQMIIKDMRHTIKVEPSKLKPKFNNIGHGNPRYNSMVVYKGNLMIPIGCTVRLINMKTKQILMNKQIGCSQIFQIQQNDGFIMVVNFQGLITLLSKQNLQICHQFKAIGKEIRHSAFTNEYISTSSQLNPQANKTVLQVFRMKDILDKKYQSCFSIVGDYYYPEIINNELVVIQYQDPNPKGRSRKQTVLNKKLPVKHRIVKFDHEYNIIYTHQMQIEGEIVCTISSKQSKQIYYLHTTKKITMFDSTTNLAFVYEVPQKITLLCLQTYKQGVVYASSGCNLAYLYLKDGKIVREDIAIKSMGMGGNISMRKANNGFYLFNENGLYFHSFEDKKDYNDQTFSITNCGLSFNPTGTHYAVADFGGTVYVMETQSKSMIPQPISQLFIGTPIRTLIWCTNVQKIIIGCVGGSLLEWCPSQPQCKLIDNFEHTVNILRCSNEHVFAGTSDGDVNIYEEQTMKKVYNYKAHYPIKYQDEKDREMFGSLKNYAEIWSLAISPVHHEHLVVVSSSEDQTEKVHAIKQDKIQLLHHLKGHHLAVTSVDWKIMGKGLGQIYVSCSDDKIVRFRNPQKNFQIMFQLETTTIKEWHTLTYLALQPKGYRVAVGTQNGYLFIFDIDKREIVFGEKIHLGGIEGLDWKMNKICTISSDLCISILQLE